MKLKRIYSVVAMLGVVMMALAIAGCGTKTVSVADVTYKDMPLQIHNDANVTALNKATVTPTLTGQVAYAVKVGDQVQQGQVLATVDTSALQQQLASLQGQLAQAQAQSYATSVTTTTAASVDSGQLAQAQKMREAGMITQKEYDRIVERVSATNYDSNNWWWRWWCQYGSHPSSNCSSICTNGSIYNRSAYSWYSDCYLQ